MATALVALGTYPSVVLGQVAAPDSLACAMLREGRCAVYNVSMVQLIAAPERWQGQRVRVVGFLNLEFEGNAIYLHREDHEKGLTRNGLWVDFLKDAIPEDTRVSRRYVLVEGVFDARNRGHLALWSGGIREISWVRPWR